MTRCIDFYTNVCFYMYADKEKRFYFMKRITNAF